MDLGWMLDRVVRMRLAGGLFLLWGVTACLRCLDGRNRRRLACVGGLLSAWMLLAIVKWKLPEGPADAPLWYSYYVPMTVVPLLCLLCAARASGLDRRPWAPAAARALWCAAAAIVALVLTNDLHEQVFRFLGPVRSDAGPYIYGWGHRLVVAWTIGCYLGFFGLFVAFSRRRLRGHVLPVAALCVAGFAFSMAYARQHHWAASINYSLAYCLLVAASLELCLDLGFIASARSFAELFDSLPFDLKVMGRGGEVYRATRVAEPLAADVGGRLAAVGTPGGGPHPLVGPIAAASPHAPSGFPRPAAGPRPAAPEAGGEAGGGHARRRAGFPDERPEVFSLEGHPHKLFHLWELAGGHALLTQDTSDLDDVTDALMGRRDELRRTAQMLERRRQTEAVLGGLSAERALMDDVELAISSSLGEIEGIFEGLPRGDDPDDEGRRRRGLQHARMLLAFCKRKSSLVLFEQADPELDRDRIVLIANELAADLRAVGIDCASVVRVGHPVPAREMSVLYDCIYAFAFVAFSCDDPALIYFLGERDDGLLELRAQLGSRDDDDLSRRPEACELRTLLDERDVVYSLAGGGGSLRLVARMRSSRDEGAPGRGERGSAPGRIAPGPATAARAEQDPCGPREARPS